jgi:hypothetical protein
MSGCRHVLTSKAWCETCGEYVADEVRAERLLLALGRTPSSDEALFDLLCGVNLTAERVMMEDGYPSIRMRSAEEAAALVIDTLRAAGYEVIHRD